MFRSARLFAALGLALAAFGTAVLPASAQGTVREHRGGGGDTPPAPKPTVDRDQRRNYPKIDDPVQWEVPSNGTGIALCSRHQIFNGRRDGLDLPSSLTPVDASDAGGWPVAWSKDGGDWIFYSEAGQVRDDGRRVPTCTSPGVGAFVEKVAIYNIKRKKFLSSDGKWTDKFTAVWKLDFKTRVIKDKWMSYRFALFNIPEDRYLMLCNERDRRRDNALCLRDIRTRNNL